MKPKNLLIGILALSFSSLPLTSAFALSRGDRVQCIGSNVNIRPTASTSGTSLGKADGGTGTIISDPTAAQGYTWWRIAWDSPLSVTGWSVDYSGGATLRTISSTQVVNLPSVSTLTASSVSTTSAVLNGKVTNDGGSSISQRRFDWGTNSSSLSSYTSNVTVNGSDFRYTLTGLSPNTTYYFRAWAKNSSTKTANGHPAGWATGNILSFKTLSVAAPLPTPTVATPAINPGSQSTTSAVNVTMSCATSGATIRYTINGNDPISTSTVYGGSFPLNSSATVKAKAFKSGLTASAVASQTYNIVPPSVTPLTNNVAVGGLSGTASSERKFKISVPSGQTSLVIKLSGGSGDADLYVKRGSAPTTSSYDYRPYLSGNNETVTISNPIAGDWYVMVRGYNSYSGLVLLASYSTDSAYSFKLPLPGNYYWRCTVAAGGLSYDGSIDSGHTGNYYYSLDFSWRTLSPMWPSTQDIPIDIPIYAMHAGKVVPLAFNSTDSAYALNGYSLRIDMDKDGRQDTGFVSTYVHLKSTPQVTIGSNISEGTLLGYMGTTGNSTGIHLHLRMHYNNDGGYGTGGQGQTELEKVLIEGLKIRSFQVAPNIGQQPGYYRSSR